MSFFKKLFGLKDPKKPQQSQQQQKPQSKEDVLELFKKVPWMTDRRLENVSICLDAGFRPTNSLPTEFDRQLRPSVEIAQRLNAIKALVLWLVVPEDNLDSATLLNFVENNDLKRFMDEDEIGFLNGARDDQEARNSIGWKFENAWPLAWYFGYKEPDIMGQMMSGEQMQDILADFSCPLEGTVADWVTTVNTISEDDLMQKEDLFYCLHNAVRSAQFGRETVPAGFDPMANGGVIHERRHALTWMLSNGTSWADTDLST